MKKLLLLLPLLFGFVFYSNAQSASSKGVVSISAKKFKNMAESGRYPIIDIRTAREFDEGHIKGAININFYEKTFYGRMAEYKDKPFLFYCRSGNRTSLAMKKFKQMGFKEAYELKDGIIAWNREAFNLIQE